MDKKDLINLDKKDLVDLILRMEAHIEELEDKCSQISFANNEDLDFNG
jgi:hypothetical protein